MKKRKNPLRKRLLRELKSEFGKYLVIFLLMACTIGMVSGFLVASESMMVTYDEGIEKYNVENGHFKVQRELNRSQKKAVEQLDISVYEMYYTQKELTNGTKLRIYADRTEVNTVCLMSGELPVSSDELAIDRMYADNNGLEPGDTLSDGAKTYRITGLVALPDYSCLFEDNNDSMFDSLKFGVGIMSQEGFEAAAQGDLSYVYAWKYDDEPADTKEEADVSETLMKELNKEVTLQEYVPRYQNQAITFTREDMGGDSVMMAWLLYIVIAILAFVFGVTTSNTIAKEASVIGTLRALGYTRGELLRHYISMPVIVTLVSALVGNILGYTWIKDIGADLYYGSYSLPTYETIWNADAFVKTTVIPVILMLVINAAVLYGKLKLSPLKFLRRDLSKRKQKKALHLPHRIGFFARFRLRVIFQNMSNYIILFVGIIFANLLLIFGLVFPDVLNDYTERIDEMMLCDYQYMLDVPIEAMDEEDKLGSMISLIKFAKNVETENEDAEKFSAYSLNTLGDQFKEESITLYGVEENSRYVPVDVSGDQVYISSAYRDKYGVGIGDVITLKEAYDEDTYEFEITGIFDYEGGLGVFMSIEKLNETFDLSKDYFGGYFSSSAITDIDGEYIGTVIDRDAMTKISRQLLTSMGGMMEMIQGFALLMFMILVYLLSKIIIEKNAQSISMAKILGYTSGEIGRLYILSTSIVTVLCLLASLPIETTIIEVLYYEVMLEMITGWIPFSFSPQLLARMFFMGLAVYCVVAAFEFRKVKKVPMEEALKNVE